MLASEELLDSVYRAAIEPTAWHDVMQQLAQRFSSSAQAFYCLHRQPRRLQPVDFSGIEPARLKTFDALYFAPDNPWIQLTQRLHQPGVVRTNERLDRIMRRRGALYRSAYYNDWMRPQGLRTTLGNTLLAEDDLVANITLFRPPGMKTFSAAEVRAFERLSAHMTRALRMAVRLAHPQNVPAAAAAFAACTQPIAVLDRRRRVCHANPAMEAVWRRRDGLALRDGRLLATADGLQPALDAFIDGVASRWHGVHDGAGLGLELRDSQGRPMPVRAIPLATNAGAWCAGTPLCLLLIDPGSARRPLPTQDLRARFGFTPAELRLVRCLVAGTPLRDAAQHMGITYGTARAYLKVVFGKAGVRSQAQLVALVLQGAATAPQHAAGPYIDGILDR